MKQQKQIELDLSLDPTEKDRKMVELYGKTHIIEKRKGINVFLPMLKNNQSVAYGDGKSFYYLLTEREKQ